MCRQRSRGKWFTRLTIPFSNPPTLKRYTTCAMSGAVIASLPSGWRVPRSSASRISRLNSRSVSRALGPFVIREAENMISAESSLRAEEPVARKHGLGDGMDC